MGRRRSRRRNPPSQRVVFWVSDCFICLPIKAGWKSGSGDGDARAGGGSWGVRRLVRLLGIEGRSRCLDSNSANLFSTKFVGARCGVEAKVAKTRKAPPKAHPVCPPAVEHATCLPAPFRRPMAATRGKVLGAPVGPVPTGAPSPLGQCTRDWGRRVHLQGGPCHPNLRYNR